MTNGEGALRHWAIWAFVIDSDFGLRISGFPRIRSAFPPARAILTVGGMDFDAAGHLVAASNFEVRVYDISGNRIGGFTRSDGLLGVSNDLKVAPDGTYVVATGQTGAAQFGTDGTFLRQYGNGQI